MNIDTQRGVSPSAHFCCFNWFRSIGCVVLKGNDCFLSPDNILDLRRFHHRMESYHSSKKSCLHHSTRHSCPRCSLLEHWLQIQCSYNTRHCIVKLTIIRHSCLMRVCKCKHRRHVRMYPTDGNIQHDSTRLLASIGICYEPTNIRQSCLMRVRKREHLSAARMHTTDVQAQRATAGRCIQRLFDVSQTLLQQRCMQKLQRRFHNQLLQSLHQSGCA
jgi:hypothetical protein